MIHAQSLASQALREAGLEHDRVAAIQLNRSGPAGDFVVLLVFLDGRRDPSALVKITAAPDKAEALRREHENLTLLARHASPELRASIPEPLHLAEHDGRTVFAESAVRGRRMKDFPPDAYFRSSAFGRALAQVVEFLSELQRCGQRLALPEPEPIAESIERYRAGFRVSPALDRLLDESVERLSQTRPPLGPWHGDFCTANVLVTDRTSIGVIDWEFPLALSWPMADLLHFLASVWCRPYRKGPAAAADNFKTLFFESYRLRDTVRDHARRYVEQLGLDTGDLLPLSAACWVRYANRKREGLRELSASAGGPRGEQWPLILFEDDACLNLELLAAHRERYLLVTDR